MANETSTENSVITVLNPGAGGDSMSESAPARPDGTSPRMPRVVIAGDADAQAIVDPINHDLRGNEFAIPVREVLAEEIVGLLKSIDRKLGISIRHLEMMTECEFDDDSME